MSKCWYEKITNTASLWARIAQHHGVLIPKNPLHCRLMPDVSTSLEDISLTCCKELSESDSEINPEVELKSIEYLKMSENSTEKPESTLCKEQEEEHCDRYGDANRSDTSSKEVDSGFQTSFQSGVCETSFQSGVCDISSEDLDQSIENSELALTKLEPVSVLGSMYKRMYRHAKRVVAQFNSGNVVHINRDFIDKGFWRITAVRYHNNCVVTGENFVRCCTYILK